MDVSLYRLILDSLSEGVCTVDRDWTITYFNRAAERLTGVPVEEALGSNFVELFKGEACECHALLAQVMESGRPLAEKPTVIVDRRGARVPVNLNVTPIHAGDGSIVGLAASFRDVSAMELLRKELRGEHAVGDIVSKNPAIRRILNILPQIAESGSTVLITGPSGTGKELFASAIHHAGPRRDGPFVAVNCGALPDTLLESELFGYKQGAFTDAKRDKPGRFALAQGGTLFLDEIGDVSPALQIKLLRVLQEREYEPLGATATQKTDARIIAATNRDLADAAMRGLFRNDLFYRLNVVQIDLPPLAERREDIPLLVEHFIRALNAEKGRKVTRVSSGAMRRLLLYPFPGNVRELRNALEYAGIICQGGEIQEQCLPPAILEHGGAACLDAAGAAPLKPPPRDEKERIAAALAAHGGHRARTARAVGINASTLWRKMRKHGIS